jgi:predicted enzyme related to lactoylglutathione lyase
MQPNPIRWFEIYVQDMERARKFYEAVFQVELQGLEGTELEIWAFPASRDHYGASGALVKMEGVPSGGNSTLVYFASEDCSIEAKRAVENGGTIFREKISIGQYGYIALIIDTEGNMIGVHSM